MTLEDYYMKYVSIDGKKPQPLTDMQKAYLNNKAKLIDTRKYGKQLIAK